MLTLHYFRLQFHNLLIIHLLERKLARALAAQCYQL
jgi:hypothetical protein